MYQWHNVASYDLTFCQLMAQRPMRSWAKTYNQGWNLAMRDPISKGNSNLNLSDGRIEDSDEKNWRG